MLSAQPNAYGQQRPNSQTPARAKAPVKAPVVRAQIPDAPVSLAMPAPESFGIRLAPMDDGPLDWNQLRQRLDKLGANSFQLEKEGNGFRFACRLATGMIEGHGSTESEAVRVAMAKATR